MFIYVLLYTFSSQIKLYNIEKNQYYLVGSFDIQLAENVIEFETGNYINDTVKNKN